MKILKYIINTKKIPIIFSSKMVHNEVLQEGHSAGFLILRYNKRDHQFSVKCFGESSSLKIVKAADDENLIEDFLNNQFLTI
jgi:hypothetical protein